MINVPAHIFRAYDIRGKADTDITEELCGFVGRAFGSALREQYSKTHPTVIVGRDARTHSPTFEAALIKGLISTGCHVKTIGQTPSPVNYFAVCHFGCDGSIQVTASHNEGSDNGLKLQIRNAESFSGEELQTLKMRMEEAKFLTGEGSSEEIDAMTPYKKKLKGMVTIDHPLTVVADFGNGVAGPLYAEILKEMGMELVELFKAPDGTFPNHIADPTKPETLKVLIETVKKENADCGIAFDGDGDRVGFVDENGRIITADYLLLLLAEDHLKRQPGATVIYTCAMSSMLETEVQKLGGTATMCIVGHSFVEHAMKEHGSHLGGEQSGHFFCGEDFYDHDDALVTTLRILSIFSETRNQPARTRSDGKPATNNQSFSSLFSHYPRTFQSPEWRPHCDDNKKTDVIKRITQFFQGEGYPCETMDGVRIDFGGGGWAAIRQSNTSPKISICVEARSEAKLQEIEDIVKTHIDSYKEIGE
jgi:phosphomannomutase / phosphoglucomutase